MGETVAQAVSTLTANTSLRGLDEAGAKQGVVLRLLSLVGWNAFDISEIVPEYTVESRRVDYALKIESINKVFIEVKRPSEDLEGHQEQLLDYCFKQGVRLAVLTNGRTWWLYLPLREGSWEQRRFLTIDLESQEPQVVESRLLQFLSRESVASDSATAAAEELIASRERIETMTATVTQAWNEIIQTPDDLLVDLISEVTERLCGFKPESVLVARFLAQHLLALRITGAATTPDQPLPHVQPSPSPHSEPSTSWRGGDSKPPFTGTRPTSVSLYGQSRATETWIEVLVGVCNSVYERSGDDFTKVLEIRGRRRPYFSVNGNELRQPRLLAFARIYVESNLSANAIVSLRERLLAHFRMQSNALAITTA